MMTGIRIWSVRWTLLAVIAAAGFLSMAPIVQAAGELDAGPVPQNVIQVVNAQSQNLVVQGEVQLNRISGTSAQPLNEAYAYSSCSDCQTFAVALQIDLISTTATDIAPGNYALAVNYQCTHCTSVADAYQYVIQVPDPLHADPYLQGPVAQLNAQFEQLTHEPGLTAAQVQDRINEVIANFQLLAQDVSTQQPVSEYERHSEKQN